MTTKTGSKLVNSVRRARTNQAEQKSDEAVVESLDVKQPKTTVIEAENTQPQPMPSRRVWPD